MGVLALRVSSHLPCVKAARQANEPERQLHKTKERGKKEGTKEMKGKRQASSFLWGCHIPSRNCRELCLRVCLEGLQVGNDNHPGSAANLSALPCVCVSGKTAEGLPAGKV